MSSSSSSSSSTTASGSGVVGAANVLLGVRESISGKKLWLDANGDEMAVCGGKACVYLSGDRVALRSCQKVSLIVTRRQKQSVLRHGNVLLLQPKDTFYANGTLTKYEVISCLAGASASVAVAATAAQRTNSNAPSKPKQNTVTSRFFQARCASNPADQREGQAMNSGTAVVVSAHKRLCPFTGDQATRQDHKKTRNEVSKADNRDQGKADEEQKDENEEDEEDEETPSRPNRSKRRLRVDDDDDSDDEAPAPSPRHPKQHHEGKLHTKNQSQHPVAIEVDSSPEEDDVFLLEQQQHSTKWMDGFAFNTNPTGSNHDDNDAANGWINVNEFKSSDRKPNHQRNTNTRLATTSNAGNRNRARMPAEHDDDDHDQDDDSDHEYESRSHGELSQILRECTRIGQKLRNAVKDWSTGNSSRPDAQEDDDEGATSASSDGEVSEQVTLCSFNKRSPNDSNSRTSIITDKDVPGLCETLELKPYQTVGLNWLLLLYRNNLSGVLADEMGLGKTVQAICCLQYLHSRPPSSDPTATAGPHLIVVPASVLSNWQREFAWIAPSLGVVLYHGSKKERYELQETLAPSNFDVLLTTYTYFERDSCQDDRIFLKSFRFKYLILDEGHSIKNFKSSRFKRLTCMRAQIRLVLSGTPIQNNLNELLALLSFMMPKMFDHGSDELLSFFDGTEAAKAKQIRRILAPFILRREKKFVLNQLVPKTIHVEMLALESNQRTMYDNLLEKVVQQKEMVATHQAHQQETKARRKSKLDRQVQILLGDAELLSERELARSQKCHKHLLASSDSAIFTQLRKAANHPVLLRQQYAEEAKMSILAQELHRVQAFGDSCTVKMVRKELDTYCDYELHDLCVQYAQSSTELRKLQLQPEILLKSAKFDFLRKLLPQLHADGHRILIFSQWTRLLDLMENLMDALQLRFLRLDGSTQVSTRQSLIDEFNDDKDIAVFLLSTRAGGLGVNLTAADVVILHDLDFNPSNDEQACDRCHRIGQTKPVTIYKLVAQDTVDHEIFKIGQVKTQLNDAVLGKLNARIEPLSPMALACDADGDAGAPAPVTVEMLLASVLSTYKKNL